MILWLPSGFAKFRDFSTAGHCHLRFAGRWYGRIRGLGDVGSWKSESERNTWNYQKTGNSQYPFSKNLAFLKMTVLFRKVGYVSSLWKVSCKSNTESMTVKTILHTETVPFGKVTWQFNIPMFNRKYIIHLQIVHFQPAIYVNLPECTFFNQAINRLFHDIWWNVPLESMKYNKVTRLHGSNMFTDGEGWWFKNPWKLPCERGYALFGGRFPP